MLKAEPLNILCTCYQALIDKLFSKQLGFWQQKDFINDSTTVHKLYNL